MSIDYYTYELKKSRVLGGFLGNKVAIREDWVKRTRRYVVAQGLDLNALATFVKKGLYDRRVETFNEKALEKPLSKAQQWTLMWLILQEFGVPEWLQDPEKDEEVPEMVVPEPEEEPESVVNALLTPANTVVSAAGTVTGAAVSATSDAGKSAVDAGKAVGSAALSVAAVPVKTLSSIVGTSAEKEAEEAIAEADEVISEASADESADSPTEEVTETEAPGTEVTEEVTETEAPDDAEVGQSGE